MSQSYRRPAQRRSLLTARSLWSRVAAISPEPCIRAVTGVHLAPVDHPSAQEAADHQP
ncbi:hypothetical protein [Streptomyces sp. NPDC018967]|uniref:hypothetical protein n=1 Tax=Streptomyces sp. NPDC018967 TaxID=3365059 RepID=UPI0037AA2D2F